MGFSCGRLVPQKDPPLIAAKLEGHVAVATAIRAHYTNYSYRIAMRDGVKLFLSLIGLAVVALLGAIILGTSLPGPREAEDVVEAPKAAE